MKPENSHIHSLFQPTSIAVIGASTSPGKIGYKVLENIHANGYTGDVYPVNPSGGILLGYSVFTSVTDLPDHIDVAVIILPAKWVLDTVKACGEKKVKFLTIISSGFSEIGALEEEKVLVEMAHRYGMRILGPNIFGHYSRAANLNATFGPRDIKPGSVAIITQSGALGVAMIGKTAIQNIGLSAIISVGNKSDMSESDLLDYLVKDPLTNVILMYIEGIQQGEELIQKLRSATRQKPIIVIKSGRSRRGAIAAASHTGSLAGSDDIFDAIMKQVGVLRAENVQEALNWCRYLSQSPMPKAEGTVIITNGGGVGVLATDACEKYGVHLYEDHNRLNDIYQDVIHGFGSAKNPIDLTGEGTEEDYKKALRTALKDDHIHSVLALYCETAMMSAEQLCDMIEKMYSEYTQYGMPIAFAMFGGEKTAISIDMLTQKNIPVFGEVYEAVSSLGAQYSVYKTVNRPLLDFSSYPSDKTSILNAIQSARNDRRTFLLADEGQAILDAVDIHRPTSRVTSSISEAVDTADDIGYPVVMKVVSQDILHKSDVGGVLLNLNNAEEVSNAWQTIMHKSKAFKPNANIQGIEVTEQIKPGTEVIIGARRDSVFGPIVMFGLGGIYVEVMKDIVFRAMPLHREAIYSMIKHIKSYPMLMGARGQDRRDIEALVVTIEKVMSILMTSNEITDIEINPLMVYEDGMGVKAVEIRILLTEGRSK